MRPTTVVRGWLLLAGMVLYALVLTTIHVGRGVVDVIGAPDGDESPSTAVE